MAGDKYARVEIERRFLLAGVPDGEVVAAHDIDDLYIEGTSLRLRRMARHGGETRLKLTQKLPCSTVERTLTTIYLTEAEHAVFDRLPGARLRKTRLSIPPYCVDVFASPLDGLVLAEVEFPSVEGARAFVPADYCVAEVTTDIRYTGGSLARGAAPPARAVRP